MIKTTSFISTIFFVCIVHTSTFAQKDYSSELKKQIVKIEAGKYVSTDLQYLTFSDGSTKQLKITSSCPVDIVGRDNFIYMYSSLSMALVLQTFTAAGLEMPDMKELDELIGDPDITYNLVMAKNGIQIQVKTAEGNENVTMQWSEIFD